MDLAADVATMVLKEIERDDGECPFYLTCYLSNNDQFVIRGFVLKGKLRFRFVDSRDESSMVVENPATLCFLIHMRSAIHDLKLVAIRTKLGVAFYFEKIHDTQKKKTIESIVSAYIDVCKCN